MTPLQPLTLRVLSPEGILLEANGVTAVNVPLVDSGGIGIRPGHAPLIAETVEGNVQYQTKSQENRIAIMPGILSISDNTVTILTSQKIGGDFSENDSPQDNEFPRLIQAISQALYPEKDSPMDKVV
jgi:F0F1-type ATP synthase epsilon subunit